MLGRVTQQQLQQQLGGQVSLQRCRHFRAAAPGALRMRAARQMAPVRASLIDPDNANILVCGGGGVAMDVTRKLKDMGSWVWAMQRSDTRRSEIEKMMAVCARGDAMSKADVAKVFDQIEDCDAVISSIGGTTADPAADSEGNINVIEEAIKRGVKKFILVTSIGTGDSKNAPPEHVYKVLEPVLVEKEKAEQYLKDNAGSMQWVIVRPGGLKSEPATGTGVLTADTSICGAITREDVADLVIKALLSDKTNGQVLSAVDKAQLFGEPQFEVAAL